MNIKRYWLELKSKNKINPTNCPFDKVEVKLQYPPQFNLNKFLYKQIGEKYFWLEKREWPDQKWKLYTEDKNFYTWIMTVNSDLAGYYEIYNHSIKKEVEIIQLGILKKYLGKKLGGYLLSHALNKSWNLKPNKIKVHTCDLDHPNALSNYKSRGMKIYDIRSQYIKV